MDAGGEPGEVELYYDAGLRVSGGDFQWEEIENEKGKYDFTK